MSRDLDKLRDKQITDKYGNVISDKYGDVFRENGVVVTGLDGVIRNNIGATLKDEYGRVLIAKINYKKGLKSDGVILNEKGKVLYDDYGMVKRDSSGNVIIGPERVIRDADGFAYKNREGRVLISAYYPKEKEIKNKYIEEGVGETDKDSKKIMNEILNIDVPGREGVKFKDILNSPGKADINKILINAVPFVFANENSEFPRFLAMAVSFLFSNAVKSSKVSNVILNNIGKILKKSNSKLRTNYEEILVKLIKNNSSLLSKFKKLPLEKILPIVITGIIALLFANKNRVSEFSSDVTDYLKGRRVKLNLNTSSSEDITRVFMEREKVLKKGSDFLELEFLGLKGKNTVKNNSEKGIDVVLVQPINVDKPLTVKLLIENEFLDNVIVTVIKNIPIIKNSSDLNRNANEALKEVIGLKQFIDILFAEHIYSDVVIVNFEKINRLELKLENIGDYIISGISDKKVSELKNEEILIKSKIEEIKGELGNVGIKYDEESIDVIQRTAVDDKYSERQLASLNILKGSSGVIEKIIKSIKRADKKNINLILIKASETLNVLRDRVSMTKRYDPRNALQFFRVK